MLHGAGAGFAAGDADDFQYGSGQPVHLAVFYDAIAGGGGADQQDGRGRVFDNIFVERLWRSVKYERLYLYEYDTVPAVTAGLAAYFVFYNTERPHQSLGYQTPAVVHAQR